MELTRATLILAVLVAALPAQEVTNPPGGGGGGGSGTPNNSCTFMTSATSCAITGLTLPAANYNSSIFECYTGGSTTGSVQTPLASTWTPTIVGGFVTTATGTFSAAPGAGYCALNLSGVNGVAASVSVNGTHITDQTAPNFQNSTTPNSGLSITVTNPSAGNIQANITGTPSIPIGNVTGLGTGIATWLATPTSANLLAAMTTSTGTGNLVFSISPVFTTPNLGTPSAATLTNAAGLPIAGIAGLGTGVAGALAAAVSGTGGICLTSGSACGASGSALPTTTFTSSSVLTVCGNCTTGTPVTVANGSSSTYTYTGSATITINSGTGDEYNYIDGSGNLTACIASGATLSLTGSGITVVSGCTNYAYGSIPLSHWHATASGVWDSTAVSGPPVAVGPPTVNAGAGISISQTPTNLTITNTASGSVTSVGTGSCLTGGPVTGTGTISFNGPVLGKSANYTTTAGDFSACSTIVITSGNPQITLVAAGSQPAQGQIIHVINYGGGTPTVVRNGQNINGSTSAITLLPGNSAIPTDVWVGSDGTNYFAAGNTGTSAVANNLGGATTNSIPYQTGLSITGYISPVNSAVLVTNGSGVPSESTTLPTGLAMQTPASINLGNATNLPTGALATVQGNGAKVQLSTGTTTTNDCVKFDANGNTVDAGAACGSGGGTAPSCAVTGTTTLTFTLSGGQSGSNFACAIGALTANVTAVTIAGTVPTVAYMTVTATQGTGPYTVAAPTGFASWQQTFQVNAIRTAPTYVTTNTGTNWDILNGSSATYGQMITGSAPGTPPSGYGFCWFDSTDLDFECKSSGANIFKGFLSGVDANPVTGQVTATHLASALPVNQGGTGTTSTLTGIVRGGSPMTASELSGDATTSGSNAVTVAKVNGVSYPVTPSTHQTPVVTASNTVTYKTIPDCQDSGGNHLNYTQSTDLYSCGNTSSGGGGSGTPAKSNVTPVTANASSTSPQQLQEISLPAGYLNTSALPVVFHSSGIFSTILTPTVTLTERLCTVSGCGSGTVISLVVIASTATVSGSNNQFNVNFACGVATTGATGNLICHGFGPIDLTSASVTSTVFTDGNTAVSSNIDLTAALFFDTFVTFSSGSTSNSMTNQLSFVAPQGAGGSITSISTTSPITGGTITTTGTIACATCVVASSPGIGLAHFAGSTQTVTSSTVATADIANNAVTSAQMAVVNTRRSCIIDNDTQSGTALTAAQFSGKCVVPYAATIVEVDVSGGTQTLTGTATAPTFTGTSSIQIGKKGVTNNTGLLSAALATASGVACALTTTAGTCIFNNGMTSSGSVTISTTAISAGDEIYVSAATADSTQTWYNVTIVYTVN